jgi:tricorn protease
MWWKLLPENLCQCSSRLDSYSPAWTNDNQWLYFLSDRNLKTKIQVSWGPRQPEPYYSEFTGIYAIPVNAKINFRFCQKIHGQRILYETTIGSSRHSKDSKSTAPLPLAKPVNWQEAALQIPGACKNGKFQGADCC